MLQLETQLIDSKAEKFSSLIEWTLIDFCCWAEADSSPEHAETRARPVAFFRFKKLHSSLTSGSATS